MTDQEQVTFNAMKEKSDSLQADLHKIQEGWDKEIEARKQDKVEFGEQLKGLQEQYNKALSDLKRENEAKLLSLDLTLNEIRAVIDESPEVRELRTKHHNEMIAARSKLGK